MDETRKDDREKRIEKAGIAAAQQDVVQRYGAAIKEHLVAYSGEDRERGQTLSRHLKGISKSKVSPQNADTNLKQQAGFSAEVKAAARENAEKQILGVKDRRTVRTDDIPKQADGRGGIVGGRNDRIYDLAEVDGNGIYITGSGRQLKFVGGTAEQCADRLLDRKYDKYRKAGADLEIPNDFYETVQERLEDKSKQLKEQISHAKAGGDHALAKKKQEQLARVEQTKAQLRKSNVSNREAMEARVHPALSTVKDVTKLSHRAGTEAAKTGALLGGGLSFIRNSVRVVKGEMDPQDAACAVAKDTATAVGVSYATGFAGSALKGAMQNASSGYVQALSKTGLPGNVIITGLQAGKTLYRFGKGELNGTECLTELGESGVGMLASGAGAALGTAVLPGIGTVIGGMLGYAMSTSYYHDLVCLLQEAKLSEQERIRVEAECHEAIEVMTQYRLEIEAATERYLQEHTQVFLLALTEMETACLNGDADGFVAGANAITEKLGQTPQFKNKAEFDRLMNNDASFVL